MQSKETILEIVTYSKEHNITYKERCAEVGVPLWDFYESKQRYKSQEARPGNGVGEFIQLRPDGSERPAGHRGRAQERSAAGSRGRTGAGVKRYAESGVPDSERQRPPSLWADECRDAPRTGPRPVAMFSLNDTRGTGFGASRRTCERASIH